jgi:hypothetical protein
VEPEQVEMVQLHLVEMAQSALEVQLHLAAQALQELVQVQELQELV